MKNINKGLRLTQGIRIIGLLLVLSAGFFLVPLIAQAFTFTIIDVPFPGAFDTQASGINPSTDIVGAFSDSSNVQRGYLLDKKGNFTTIDIPGTTDSAARGINPSSKIVGAFIDSSGVAHGYLLDKKGNFTTIDIPGATRVTANGINPSGDIVGDFTDSSGVIHGYLRSKRIRPNNTQNQALAVKGAFIKIIDDPNAGNLFHQGTQANGITPSGDIVGFFIDSSNATHGFLLNKNGNFTTIDVPGSVGTAANGINPSGDIVGVFFDSSNVEHGFLLDKNGNFTTIDVPDAIDTQARGINPSGQIVGAFVGSDLHAHGFFASPNK